MPEHGPRLLTTAQRRALYMLLRDGYLNQDRDGPIDVEALTVGGASTLISIGKSRQEQSHLGFKKEEPSEPVEYHRCPCMISVHCPTHGVLATMNRMIAMAEEIHREEQAREPRSDESETRSTPSSTSDADP